MSGLDSIALAVAHLEDRQLRLWRQRVQQHQQQKPDESEESSRSPASSPSLCHPLSSQVPMSPSSSSLALSSSPSASASQPSSSSLLKLARESSMMKSNVPLTSITGMTSSLPLMPQRQGFHQGPRIVSLTDDSVSAESTSMSSHSIMEDNHHVSFDSITPSSPLLSSFVKPSTPSSSSFKEESQASPAEELSMTVVPSAPSPSALAVIDPWAWLAQIEAAEGISSSMAPFREGDGTEEDETSVPPPPPSNQVITHVLPNDVLCGRGGETNHHLGNVQYRNLVKSFQPLYIASKRRDKPRIAQCIVSTIRKRGGRFLKRTDPRSSTWVDVGNTKAREKTSQALREGAPELRGGAGNESSQDISMEIDSTANSNKSRTSMNMSYSNSNHGSHPLLTTSATFSSCPIVTPPFPKYQQQRKRSSADFTRTGIMMSSNYESNNKVLPVTVVSTDDDDANPDQGYYQYEDDSSSRSSSGSMNDDTGHNVCRGPRLKRLKKRLELELESQD